MQRCKGKTREKERRKEREREREKERERKGTPKNTLSIARPAQEAAEGRRAHNNVRNGANGMASDT